MERIIVTIDGILGLQVCCERDVTDEEIIQFLADTHPSGTRHGWNKVIRDPEDELRPVVCQEDPNRLHLIVQC